MGTNSSKLTLGIRWSENQMELGEEESALATLDKATSAG